MVRPNTRDTNEIVAEQSAIVSAASNNRCACPPVPEVIYVRWGNFTCPYGADITLEL